jgi:LPS-assembly protein
LALENSWPLSKASQKTQQSITPNLFLKYTTGKMNDASNKSGILNYTDIFSMNRTNDLDAPETGLSLGHGIKYSFDRKIDDINKLNSSFGIGQVLRNSRLEQMPTKTSLNNKSSDIAGFVNFNYDFPKQENNNNLSFDYNFNLSNDLQRLNRNNLGINWNYNKFSSSLIYDEKNDHVGDQRTAYINIKKIYNNNYFFKYEGKKNLLNDTSEYHKFSLNFENDCITTSIVFSKSFYQDEDITSTKNLIFSIILRPFGDGIAPDLTSFIN